MSTSVLLINPKYPHNVGGALRACAAFGVENLYWTGDRATLYDKTVKKKYRLPREERMRGYNQNVKYEPLPQISNPKNYAFFDNHVPVALEVRRDFRPLNKFEHPENAIYLFGPEDGSLGAAWLSVCYHHVYIPAGFCLNLAAAVNVVLYDRYAKRADVGEEEIWFPGQKIQTINEEMSMQMMQGFEGS